MAENRKAPSYRGYPSLIFATGTIASLMMFSFLVQPVSAFGVISYATSNAGADGDYVIRVGGYVFVCSANRNVLTVQEADNPGVLYQSIAGLTTGCAGIVAYDGKVYTIDATTTGTLREFARSGTTWFLTGNTVALGAGGVNCGVAGDFHQLVTNDGFLYCGRAGTSDTFVKVNLNTMAIAFTSTNILTQDGCSNPGLVVPNRSTGYTYVFVNCSDRINVYTDGTNTLQHSLALTTGAGLCVSQDQTVARVLVTRGATAPIYLNYTAAAGFTTVLAATDVDGTVTYCTYDQQGNRFTVHSANLITGYDLDDGSVLFTTGTFYAGSAASVGRPMWWYYDGENPEGLMYGGGSTQDLWYVFDMEGLPTGGGGVPAGTSQICDPGETAVDVNLDGNADICAIDSNGDGILDIDFNDLPWSAGDPADTIPAFFQVFGFNEDASNLIASIIIHIIVVFGTAGVFFWVTKASPPMFIWVATLVFGGGLAAAIGVMPLLFFFVEIALVVGAVAALVKAGVIGS